MIRLLKSALLFFIVIGLAACASADRLPAEFATVDLTPLDGSDVYGTVTLVEASDGVRINAEVTGLAAGKHGFHIHEGTSCDAPGGHFTPNDDPHGAPSEPTDERHLGDLGNLVADASGTAAYERTDRLVTLDGPQSVVGRVVIVHQGEDQYLPQPSGDAGPKVACGVIMQDLR